MARGHVYTYRAEPHEQEWLKEAAAILDLPVSTFVRETALRVARRVRQEHERPGAFLPPSVRRRRRYLYHYLASQERPK